MFPSTPAADGQPSGRGFDTDYLKDLRGEPLLRPAEGQSVKRPDGSKAARRYYHSEEDTINLAAVF